MYHRVAKECKQTQESTMEKDEESATSERLLTRAEVAVMFGVHPNTVRNLSRRGVLTEINISGSTVRYRLSDVQELLRRCERKDCA